MARSQANNVFSSRQKKRGATMIELMGMLAILGLGIASMFSVIVSGVNFAKDTEDTIKAINLAREGIEGVTNIRNTNWLRFTSDRLNCWKVQGYNSGCIGNTTPSTIPLASSILYTANGLWYLTGTTALNPNSNWASYSTTYAVIKDQNGFYNQTGANIMSSPICASNKQNGCRTIFTREIQLTQGDPTDSGSLTVKSIVYWNTKRLQKVELTSSLTNWKAKF